MDNQIVLLRETASIQQLADQAISAVINGDVDPITAHINLCRMEKAIQQFKNNRLVQDAILQELAKYGTRERTFGDCELREGETAVKWDYSVCGDSVLEDMERTMAALEADIKERKKFLQSVPREGIANPDTGEVLFPATKTSKTTIFTTFKKS